jgi:hypothetical protein
MAVISALQIASGNLISVGPERVSVTELIIDRLSIKTDHRLVLGET